MAPPASTDDFDEPDDLGDGDLEPDLEAGDDDDEFTVADAAREALEEHGETDETDVPGAEPAITAPDHWPESDRDFLAALPDDEARARVLSWRKQIEAGAQAKFDQAAEARRESAELSELFGPLESELRQAGVSRTDAIRRLLAADSFLRRDPSAALAWLAGQYGARLDATARARLGQALGVTGEGPSAREEALERALAHQRHQAATAGPSEREQALEHELMRQRLAVANEAAGNIAAIEADSARFPHFQVVRERMGRLMASGAAGDLSTAYEMATWATPELREGLIRSQQMEAAKRAAEARRASIAKARRARTPISTSIPARAADADSDLPMKAILLEQLARSSRAGRV